MYSGNVGFGVVFSAKMTAARLLLPLLLTLAACDEQSAPCAADDAAGSSSGGSDSGASTGVVEPPEAACVFALGQCWCDGELQALVPGAERTCMCGDAVAPTDACLLDTDCAVGDDRSCYCGDYQGEPRVGADPVGDGRLCYCGHRPATPVAIGGDCMCGDDPMFSPLCYTWDGSSCFDLAGAEVPPQLDGSICYCGMTVLEPEHCTG